MSSPCLRKSICSGLPAGQLSCLDHILSHLTYLIPNFAHVSDYTWEVLRWHPLCQCTEYRVESPLWHCQLGPAPTCLLDLYQPVLELRAVTLSVLLGGVCCWSHLPVRLLLAHFQLWADDMEWLLPRMLCECSIISKRLFILAMLELEAILSRPLKRYYIYTSPDE